MHQEWTWLHRALGAMFNHGLRGSSRSADTAQFSRELADDTRRIHEIDERFRSIIDRLSKIISARWRIESPVFVVPIDDADLAAKHSVQIVDALRLLNHPSVFFLLTGNYSELLRVLQQHRVVNGWVPADCKDPDAVESASHRASEMLNRIIQGSLVFDLHAEQPEDLLSIREDKWPAPREAARVASPTSGRSLEEFFSRAVFSGLWTIKDRDRASVGKAEWHPYENAIPSTLRRAHDLLSMLATVDEAAPPEDIVRELWRSAIDAAGLAARSPNVSSIVEFVPPVTKSPSTPAIRFHNTQYLTITPPDAILFRWLGDELAHEVLDATTLSLRLERPQHPTQQLSPQIAATIQLAIDLCATTSHLSTPLPAHFFDGIFVRSVPLGTSGALPISWPVPRWRRFLPALRAARILKNQANTQSALFQGRDLLHKYVATMLYVSTSDHDGGLMNALERTQPSPDWLRLLDAGARVDTQATNSLVSALCTMLSVRGEDAERDTAELQWWIIHQLPLLFLPEMGFSRGDAAPYAPVVEMIAHLRKKRLIGESWWETERRSRWKRSRPVDEAAIVPPPMLPPTHASALLLDEARPRVPPLLDEKLGPSSDGWTTLRIQTLRNYFELGDRQTATASIEQHGLVRIGSTRSPGESDFEQRFNTLEELFRTYAAGETRATISIHDSPDTIRTSLPKVAQFTREDGHAVRATSSVRSHRVQVKSPTLQDPVARVLNRVIADYVHDYGPLADAATSDSMDVAPVLWPGLTIEAGDSRTPIWFAPGFLAPFDRELLSAGWNMLLDKLPLDSIDTLAVEWIRVVRLIAYDRDIARWNPFEFHTGDFSALEGELSNIVSAHRTDPSDSSPRWRAWAAFRDAAVCLAAPEAGLSRDFAGRLLVAMRARRLSEQARSSPQQLTTALREMLGRDTKDGTTVRRWYQHLFDKLREPHDRIALDQLASSLGAEGSDLWRDVIGDLSGRSP